MLHKLAQNINGSLYKINCANVHHLEMEWHEVTHGACVTDLREKGMWKSKNVPGTGWTRCLVTSTDWYFNIPIDRVATETALLGPFAFIWQQYNRHRITITF